MSLEGRELDWNDSIEKDSDFILLPEGDYDFTVESFERGRHNGSDKLPACNKAILKLKITSPEGEVTLTHNLFLHTITEGMLSAFFASIGQKKKGEKVTMNWSTVIGSKGKAKIDIRNWKSKSGEDMQSNEIKKFYPAQERAFVPGTF
ncbi:MAG: hypothetical protein ACK5MN_11785 [Lachnospiraceae bacterium]